MAFPSLTGGTEASGSKDVPSSPDAPAYDQQGSFGVALLCIMPTVDIGRMNRFTTERLRSTCIVRNMLGSNSREDASGVGCRVSEGCIAVDRAYAEELETWMVSSEEDGEGILPEPLAGLEVVCWRERRHTSWPGWS